MINSIANTCEAGYITTELYKNGKLIKTKAGFNSSLIAIDIKY